MKIAVCSLFKDSQSWHKIDICQVDTYFKQMQDQTLADYLDMYFVYSESSDNTLHALHANASSDNRVKQIYEDKSKVYKIESTNNPTRLLAMSRVGNLALSLVDKTINYDYLLWIESDLLIKNDYIEQMVNKRSTLTDKSIILAPLITLPLRAEPHIFYDVWAYTLLNGNKWTHQVYPKTGVYEMQSVGSSTLIDFHLIKQNINFGVGCFPELCRQARALGARIIADCDITIFHPYHHFYKNRWINECKKT